MTNEEIIEVRCICCGWNGHITCKYAEIDEQRCPDCGEWECLTEVEDLDDV